MQKENASEQTTAGKSPRQRISALKRRVKSGTFQMQKLALQAESCAKWLSEDLAEIERLEAECKK